MLMEDINGDWQGSGFFVRVVVCGEGLTLTIQVYIQVIKKTWSPNN